MPDTTQPISAAAPQPAPRTAASAPAPGIRFLSQEELSPDVARAELIDRLIHAWQARFTFAISPAALLLAFADWGVHLLKAPGKQTALVEKAVRKGVRFAL